MKVRIVTIVVGARSAYQKFINVGDEPLEMHHLVSEVVLNDTRDSK